MLAANTMPASAETRAAAAGSRRFGARVAGVFLLLAALLTLGGYGYLSHRQTQARKEAHRELSAIADLKLGQIQNWREERLSDARFFSRARFVAQDVQRFLETPNSEASRSAMLHWMELLKGGDRYDSVTVYNPRLDSCLALPAAAKPAAVDRKLLEQALQSRHMVMSDLHRDESNGPVFLDVAFPVLEGADVKQGAVLAVVLLKLNARQFLFPLVQSWPTPSQTAETLLIRQEGAEVVYLNDLRHRPGAALSLRAPLASPKLPAAMLLRGNTNAVEGVDYRGVPVVAAGRLIPDTGWGIVAKVDREEIYAPLRQQTLAALAVLGALLVAGASLVALLWRQRDVQFLERELAERKEHERQMERMNRLYAALSHVNQAVVRAGSRDELLHDICGTLVQFGGLRMAWVGWLDEATKQVVPLAQAGDSESYLKRVKVYADERPEGQGPTGTAIREGRPCVCNDTLTDPRLRLWRNLAANSDWRSVAAFPIRQEGRVRGALAVYASQSDFFGKQEQELVEEAADDVSFGLDTLLNHERRRQAEEVLSQARDELARANEALEQKVRERTAQLVEANSSLRTFAYTAAHDLRSPLRAIKNFSALVLEECAAGLGTEGRSMLERVVGSAAQMGLLLEDLLEYSKMSQAELKLEPVSLRVAVEEALALLDGDVRGKEALITVTEPLPNVIGHMATVTLVINNLISNGLKFMRAGVPPQIRIWAEEVRPSAVSSGDSALGRPPSLVRLWVQDNGIGIESEDLERIFGAFERLHGKQAYPGTGLGLAIVRKGAERMGGRVGVESEVGSGSRFWVELPVTVQVNRCNASVG